MQPVVRVGDSSSGNCSIGSECCPHGRGGQTSSGASTVTVNGRPVHRAGDIGSCDCPHGGQFSTNNGASTVTAMGRPVAKLGGRNSCMMCGQKGVLTSGSNNVTCGA